MNYSGHEVLRKEVALLVEKMNMFYMQLFEFERKYLYNSDELTERLAAQLMKPIKNQMQEIYHQIIGYGSVFKSRSEPLWGFREIIKPGAFDGVLHDDVRALFNHDANFILGRTGAGTLALSVDARGLQYDICAPDTQTIRDLVLEPMRRGDIDQSSFGFRVAHDGEHWYEDDEGIVIREIHRFSRLFDVSPVTYPAYQNTDSAVRSLKAWQEAKETGVLQHAINQRMARERLLTLLNI